jgi:hypothetical protein
MPKLAFVLQRQLWTDSVVVVAAVKTGRFFASTNGTKERKKERENGRPAILTCWMWAMPMYVCIYVCLFADCLNTPFLIPELKCHAFVSPRRKKNKQQKAAPFSAKRCWHSREESQRKPKTARERNIRQTCDYNRPANPRRMADLSIICSWKV